MPPLSTSLLVPRGRRAGASMLLLLLPAVLAGCVDGGPGTPDGQSEGAAASIPWTLSECRVVVAYVPVDRARLAAELPEGFTASDFAFSPMPLPGEPAEIGIEAFACDSGRGLDGDIEGMTYGSIFAPVVPPEDVRVEGAQQHYVKWDTLVPDGPRRERLAAAGLPVHAGTASVEASPGGVSAQFTLEGIGDFTITGLSQEPAPREGGPIAFAEYMPASTGSLAIWDASFTSSAGVGGACVVEVPAGSLAARLIGAPRAPCTYGWGVWSFEGIIRL